MARRQAPFVDVHAAVLKGLYRLARTTPVVKLSRLAREIHKDPRVVRLHLEVVQMHKEGLFVDREKSLFALKAPLEKIVRAAAAESAGLELSYDAADMMFEEKESRAVQAR